MRIISCFVILSFLFPVILFCQDNEHSCYIKDHTGRSREHNIDMTHMKLEVEFDEVGGIVYGDVLFDFVPLRSSIDTILLDAIKMNILSVELDGEDAKFKSTEKHLIIYLNEVSDWSKEHQLHIIYEASPVKGMYFIGWNDPAQKSRRQIWTQGQGIDNRHWIPSYDFQNDKLTTETIITFDKEYTVVSNGELIDAKLTEDGQKQWHYRMNKPHVSYLVMIAIGDYDYELMKSDNGIEIRQYFYRGMDSKIRNTFQYSEEMMNWMEKEFGVPYPWTTYANVPVQDFIYGAMENTTATIFTDFYLQDERAALERNYIGTNAHELVHQWFGDYITAWSGHDHWLHESFATHYSKEFRRHIQGEDLYQWIRYNEAKSALSAAEDNDLPIVHSRAGSGRHYPKGSFVIGMLKDIAGKEQFDKVLRYFLLKHKYDLVDTHDYWKAFLEVCGLNLDWFFDQWLYNGGEPHYKITQTLKKDKTVLLVDQIQEINETVGYFKMPIEVQVYYEGNSVDRKRVWINGPSDTIIIANDQKKTVAFVLFDPNNTILKKIEFANKASEEWETQLLMAENMIDRHYALKQLADVDPDDKRKTLLDAFDNEKFYAVRAEIVKQLANDDKKKSNKLILRAIYDTDMHVRRAVIENVEEISDKDLEDFESMLMDPSYVNIEKTLSKLCELKPFDKQKFLAMTADEAGHQNNIRVTWLKIAMEDDRQYLDELIELMSPYYDARSRINAIDAIKDIEECNLHILNKLSNAMTHFNRRLHRAARSALKSMYGLDDHKLKVEEYYDEGDWNEEEIDAWKKIFEEEE